MEENQNEAAFSNNVIEMITVANNFCLYIEEVEKNQKYEIFEYLDKILPLLYLKGALLPKIIVDNPEANERFVTELQWETIFNDIRNKFGKDDDFWNINQNSPDQNEPEISNLSENLSDIYQDLKDFVLLYQKSTHAAKQNASHECKVLFENNWGIKLLDSLKAIHYILHKNENDNIDEFDLF
ncbi:MAG: DUF5063 domain-containing protein [Bacteroidales bacterium]|nr:DUF5063 domain-containing protein [Bacteroidales bacterium]